MPPERECRVCHRSLPLTREHWHRAGRRREFLWRCRRCVNAERRARRAADPEPWRARARAGYQRLKQRPDALARKRERDRINQRVRYQRAKADPELRARISARRAVDWRRLKSDPKRYQTYVENRRIDTELRRARPRTRRPYTRIEVGDPRVLVPAAPFVAWLSQRNIRPGAAGWMARATDLGLIPRRTADLFNGQERVALDVVDRALVNDGSTTLFDLYPELYEDAA